jgi:hypothetical protein
MEKKRKLRPPQFRLDSLLALVMLVSMCASWYSHRNWIKQRHITLSGAFGVNVCRLDGYDGPIAAPRFMWLFGERGYFALSYDPKTATVSKEHVRALFPEALVVTEERRGAP